MMKTKPSHFLKPLYSINEVLREQILSSTILLINPVPPQRAQSELDFAKENFFFFFFWRWRVSVVCHAHTANPLMVLLPCHLSMVVTNGGSALGVAGYVSVDSS